jgi:hypothetical protein
MEWLLFSGLVLDAAGASLLFLSDLPEKIKQTVYRHHPWIIDTNGISERLYETWSRNSQEEFYFHDLSEPQMSFMYNVVKNRSIFPSKYDIQAIRFESPHLIFVRNDGSNYATACYDSPRRMFERRIEVAVTQHFSKFGALLLLAGFSLQAISIII